MPSSDSDSSESDDFSDTDFSARIESDFSVEVDSIPLAKLRPHLVALPRRTVTVGPRGEISKKYLRPTAEDIAAGWDPVIFGMEDMIVEGVVGVTEVCLTVGCDLAEGSVTSEGRCCLRVSPKNPDGSWDGFVLGGSALALTSVRLYRIKSRASSTITFSFIPLVKRAYRTREESELAASFCFYAPWIQGDWIPGNYFIHYAGGSVYVLPASDPYSPTERIEEAAGITPTKDQTRAVVSVHRIGRGNLRRMPRELYLDVAYFGDELRYLVKREDLAKVKAWYESEPGVGVIRRSPTYYPEEVLPRARAEATRRSLLKYDAYCELMYPPSEEAVRAYRQVLAAIGARP